MTKHFPLYISMALLGLLVISCGNFRDLEEEQRISDSIRAAVSRQFQMERQADSLEALAEAKRNFKGAKITSFTIVCTDQCDDGHLPTEYEVEKQGKRIPYQLKKSVDKDSITLRFRYIDKCCLQHTGELYERNDSLIIRMVSTGKKPCDCYCDFAYRLRIRKNAWKAVILEGKSI